MSPGTRIVRGGGDGGLWGREIGGEIQREQRMRWAEVEDRRGWGVGGQTGSDECWRVGRKPQGSYKGKQGRIEICHIWRRRRREARVDPSGGEDKSVEDNWSPERRVGESHVGRNAKRTEEKYRRNVPYVIRSPGTWERQLNKPGTSWGGDKMERKCYLLKPSNIIKWRCAGGEGYTLIPPPYDLSFISSPSSSFTPPRFPLSLLLLCNVRPLERKISPLSSSAGFLCSPFSHYVMLFMLTKWKMLQSLFVLIKRTFAWAVADSIQTIYLIPEPWSKSVFFFSFFAALLILSPYRFAFFTPFYTLTRKGLTSYYTSWSTFLLQYI